MKLTSTKLLSAAALAVAGLAASPAYAQNDNPNFAFGDLTVSFQNPSTLETLLVNIGGATTYRDATTSNLNFLNIGSELVSAFGAGWATTSSLWWGAEGVFSNDSFDDTVTNGDPTRTQYMTRQRNTTGTNALVVGMANSTAPTEPNDGTASGVSDSILILQNRLEQDSTTIFLQQTFTLSQIDNQLPSTATSQSAAFNGGIPGGIQDRFNTPFADFGGVTNVAGALDLYRILASTGLDGQVEGPLRVGTYEGSLLIDTQGNLSFINVPEPTSAALLGLSACVLGFVRRRKNA